MEASCLFGRVCSSQAVLQKRIGDGDLQTYRIVGLAQERLERSLGSRSEQQPVNRHPVTERRGGEMESRRSDLYPYQIARFPMVFGIADQERKRACHVVGM